MRGCPDNDVFARFVEQRLEPAEVRELEGHVDGCGECRRVLALMAVDEDARASYQEETDEPLATEALVPGTRLGRYVLLRRLGRGGLGVVYAAYDPELDRAVAVKLLRPSALPGRDGNQRLRSEARAMAKVRHANVVAVHDVGVFEGCTFIAMEQVTGTTLRARLAGERSVRAIVALFREAAEGLCAVHDAGLVHRDFKPDNVLVGEDGRVCVTDFGLATGTPIYMAPEQHAGETVDARADQYAFCVALWEALYGSVPFRDADEEALLALKRRGPPSAPRLRGVSARLRAALTRGLSSDPASRFASLRELVRVLDGAPRRRLVLAATALAALFAAGVLLPRTKPPICAEGRDQLAGVWDAERAALVQRAFMATKVPYAAETLGLVQTALDDFSGAWANERTAACRLGLATNEAAHAMAPLRSACLDEVKRELDALVGVLAEADARTVEKATALVADLPPLSTCRDDAALLRRVIAPANPEQRLEVVRLRAAVARSEALREAGRLDEASSSIEALEAEVTRTGYAPLRAEWLLARASVLQARVSGARTERALIESLRTAEAARHDRVSAEAWLRYARFLSWQGRALERAEAAVALTGGAIERMGGDARLEDGLTLVSAFVLMGRGKLGEALADLDALEARQRERLGNAAPALAATLEERWRAALVLGRYRQAHEAATRAAAIGRQSFGAQHPRMGELLHMRGAAEMRLGRLHQAEATLNESLRILEAAYGSTHTKLDFTLSDLARVRSLRGEHERALALARRAVAINEKTFAADAPPTAFARIALAEVLARSGDSAAATREAARAAAVFRATLGADHFLVIDSEALAALADKRVSALERAHRYYREHGGPPERRGQVAFALALETKERERALALAKEAERHFADLGPPWQPERARVIAWLAAR